MSTQFLVLFILMFPKTVYIQIQPTQLEEDLSNQLNEMMKTYLGLLAPIQPLLTQEAWSEYIRIASLKEDSVFKVDSKFFILSEKYENETVEKSFNEFLELR